MEDMEDKFLNKLGFLNSSKNAVIYSHGKAWKIKL